MEEKKVKFWPLFRILFGFLALAAVLFIERGGIRYEPGDHAEAYLPVDPMAYRKEASGGTNCLVVYDSRDTASAAARRQWEQILTDMRIACRLTDLKEDPLPELEPYQTSVILISDLDALHMDVIRLCEWVKEGGKVLFALPLQKTGTLDLIAGKLGILESGYDGAMVPDITFRDGFMLGGTEVFPITDAYEAAAEVSLDEQCQVYASTSDGKVPLIWSREYGDGRFVAANFGYCEKAYRGIFSASYSLLEDVCIYPVIDASAFYIDDFPSPVPSGDGEYIRRDYNMDIGEFYSGVWWPDMVRIAETYGIRYTGMIIENYDDQVEGELPRNKDTARYNYFGNMLLNMGGELGLHGYNHQPLCLSEKDYEEEDLGYKIWESCGEMKKAVRELLDFSGRLFPTEDFSVYVPPSNVLSEEGRKLLGQDFPEIKTIASIYFPGGSGYEQEFTVAEDGMVETPRVISGCDIDDYMRLAAFSELNFHYVNSHFLHPDDLLDVDRGADLGWEILRERFKGYLDWLYRSAPEIRNLTGSELAGAVQRYCIVSVEKQDTPEFFRFSIQGLQDEARFFVRFNEREPGEVTGGSLKRLTGNLYLLTAAEPVVEIRKR